MRFGLVRTVAPTGPVISLAEAKAHLRVDHTAEDTLITASVAAAERWCEDEIQRQFMTATWELVLDGFPSEIVVPRPPLGSVTSIVYIDTLGASQTLDAGEYQVSTRRQPGRIKPAFATSWPATRDQYEAVVVTFAAGYGAAGDVPEPIRQAILELIAHMYEHREPVITGMTVATLPMTIRSLLSRYWHGWMY